MNRLSKLSTEACGYLFEETAIAIARDKLGEVNWLEHGEWVKAYIRGIGASGGAERLQGAA